MFGWFGNVAICLGLYGVGNKRRGAFLFTMVGEVLFMAHTGLRGDWAVFVACTIFLVLAVRSYVLWGKEDTDAMTREQDIFMRGFYRGTQEGLRGQDAPVRCDC
jgi:hypothetical protein